jgi:hypothetical protein
MDYRFDRLISTYELQVTFADARAIHTVVKKQDGRTTDANWTADWNATVSVMTEAVIDPHTGLFRFPLRVGDTYRSQFEMAHPRGDSPARSKTEWIVTVAAWEDVTVPAGKFRALRLDAEGTYERVDRFMKGNVRSTTWYVPEVKRWVKHVYESDILAGGKIGPNLKIGEELVVYSVQ